MELDYAVVLRRVGQAFLILASMTFVVQYILPKCKKLLMGRPAATEPPTADNEARLKQLRERQQEKFSEQASSYRERILVPREEQKLRQKEEAYQRFLGPAWKGKGEVLGGEEERGEEEKEELLPPGQRAAQHRKLPEPKVKPAPVCHSQPGPRKRRVIELPEEPPAADENCITVTFRTPHDQMLQRRFLRTHTVQVLLDFITKSGFSQSFYTVSTSMPRQDLGRDPSLALYQVPDLLSRRVTLNVEERDI